MNIQFRRGYEKYETDVEEILNSFSPFKFDIIERRSDGSFYALTLSFFNNQVKNIRFYHEFIEQHLEVTIKLNDDYKSTLELNENLKLFRQEELRSIGDHYKSALQNNCTLVNKLLSENV